MNCRETTLRDGLRHAGISIEEEARPKEVTPLDAARKFKRSLRGMLSLADFERAAQKHLPKPLWAYVSGGVEDNRSRQQNLDSFLDYDF
jgi:L-lactate dehydrogenase (cytochrome)